MTDRFKTARFRRPSNPYPIRWTTHCDSCRWSVGFYDLDRADTAATVHGQLQPGHVAEVVREDPE